MPERGMGKKAAWPMLLPSIGDIGKTVGDLGAMGAAYLIAAAVAAGTGAGWLGAKMTAHGERDMDTMRKSYENQRLRADIGYLKSKVQQEHGAAKQQNDVRSARVLGI
jgi:hypothetical protein